MANAYTVEDLLKFLDHAGDKGLMPAATAQALAVASRNVMGVLSEQEKKDLSQQDMDSVVKRFNNKRARDFSPSSLKEYGRRVHKAVDLFLKWREDPSNFTVKTRATSGSRKKDQSQETAAGPDSAESPADGVGMSRPGTYHSSIPVRPGVVVTLANVPHDLSKAEAERLANFVRMLAIES
jgi:hypothetical protein